MKKFQGNRWLTLTVLCIGFLMILIDTTIVNVSIPTIIRDLNANLTEVEWVISGYALSFAALLITFGRLGDMYGRKKFFLLGLAVFTIASFLSGEASNINVLIAARLFQGVGGAMISPVTLSIISSTFKGKERATAFGIWGAIAGIAVALGPILGGIFTTYYTWRWIFRVNIPIGIIGLIVGYLVIPEAQDLHKQKLDISGMITSTLGFVFLVFGLIEGQQYGWIRPAQDFSLGPISWSATHSVSIIFLSFILSVVFIGWFIFIQGYKTRKGLAPAVNLDFFKYRSFRYGLVAIGVISLGEFSSLFTFPIFVQSVKGYTPLQSGYAILPLALAVMVAAPLSGKLVNKLGSKWVITAGISLEFLGLLLLSRLRVSWTYWDLVPSLIVLGAGIGMALAQNTQVILSEITPMQSGSASGVLNTIRQIGTALGIAIIGAVLANNLANNIGTNINSVPNLPAAAKTSIVTSVDGGTAAYGGQTQTFTVPAPPAAVQANPLALAAYNKQVQTTTDDVEAAIYKSLTDAIGVSILVGAVFVFIGAGLSLLIPSVKHDGQEEVLAAH